MTAASFKAAARAFSGSVRKFCDKGKKTFLEDIRQFCKENKKTFFVLFSIYVLGISAIIRANVSYKDDMGRALTGEPYYPYGRLLSNRLSLYIHTSYGVWDISPLTQLIAMAIMAAAGCAVIHLLSKKRGFSLWTVLAVLPMGLSPYFLECVSYKFDSPYMALSIFASVVPFLFRKYGLLPYCAASVAGCLAMCTTYQAASGIYPILTALLLFLEWNSGRSPKELLKFFSASLLSYVAALVYFQLRLFPKDKFYGGYTETDPSTLSGSMENLRTYFYYIRSDFKRWWLLLLLLMAAAFIYAAARDTARKSRWSLRALSALLAAVTLLVITPLSFGVYIALTQPNFQPRGMFGFGVLIALVGVCLAGADKLYPAKLACLLLSWVFLVFAFVYGNALAESRRYADFRVQSIVNDLKDLDMLREAEPGGEKLQVQIRGNMSQSPVLDYPREHGDFKLLGRLLPYTFYGRMGWNDYYFSAYFGLGDLIKIDRTSDFTELDLPLLKDNLFHTIWGADGHILIEVKH